MKRIIHLKTSRVFSYGNNGLPKIETSIIKLEDGSSFLKFVKHIPLKGYSETPQVVRVVEDGVDVRTDLHQQVIDELIRKTENPVEIDYREVARRQEVELNKQQEIINSFAERLNKLEAPKYETSVSDVDAKTDVEFVEQKSEPIEVKKPRGRQKK